MELNKANVDILLMRNWFVDDYDILDLLDWLDQDVYDHVYENRSKYPTKVWYYIEPSDFRIPRKFRLKELTDFDLFKEEKEKQERKEQLWQKYLNENNIKRPSNHIDMNYESKQKEIYLSEKQLKDVKTKFCSKSNIPKRDKEIEKIENKIIDLKNELRNLFSEIKVEDEQFIKSTKQKWLTQ